MLEGRGIERIGLVGHSFGGAVVIEAAARTPQVATVVALATQAYGTERADQLSPRPLLLIHGVEDEILPAGSSRIVYERARAPKRIHLIEGARHVLDEAADEVHREVVGWLTHELLGR
jgi:pimeloyl-ACP methyl ester carboxylesterase